MPIEHSDIGLAEIHLVHNWEYANAAARTGASGFIASDVGKWAKQLDDGSFWELTATTPTWAQRTGAGSSGPATQIDETGGPSTLDIGAIVDGEFLKRVGTDIVSASVPGGAEAGANSDITSMDGLTGALENPTQIIFPEGAAPSTPGANKVTLYAKSDGHLYQKDDAGTETDLTGGGGAGGAILTEDLSDDKITALPVATTMLNTDLFVIVDDPGGTPITKQISKANALLPEVNQGENFGSASKRWAVTFSAQFNAKAGDEYRWEASSRLIDLGDGFLLYRSNAGGTVKLSLGDSSSAATMIKRNGIVLEVRLGDDSAYGPLMAGSVRTNPVTFANVPGTPVEGMLVTVTDSSTATWGATITGGGANRVLAYFNGTNWTVAAA